MRVIKYLQFKYINRLYKTNRSEKDVLLTKILSTSLGRKFELKKTMDRAISLNKEDVDKTMNKDEAGEELLKVIDKLNFHINPPVE